MQCAYRETSGWLWYLIDFVTSCSRVMSDEDRQITCRRNLTACVWLGHSLRVALTVLRKLDNWKFYLCLYLSWHLTMLLISWSTRNLETMYEFGLHWVWSDSKQTKHIWYCKVFPIQIFVWSLRSQTSILLLKKLQSGHHLWINNKILS